MQILDIEELTRSLVDSEIIDVMSAALIAQSRGECDTPMPMHLDIAPEHGEVHMKSSYRRGGKYFALKTATAFPKNPARGLAVGSGTMLLSSAETGQPVAMLDDGGHLTDVRTAAVSAMVAQALGRNDSSIGILGTGIQARLQARLHAAILNLKRIFVWGRTPQHVEMYKHHARHLLPDVHVQSVASPAELAQNTRLIITVTASRRPLLDARDVLPGTHISAVGADSVGKQELNAGILRRASLLLVDSLAQCEKLGELQHALDQTDRATEVGEFLQAGAAGSNDAVTVCDFTGLGVEDLYIAEYCYSRCRNRDAI